jgi:competence protein ComEC
VGAGVETVLEAPEQRAPSEARPAFFAPSPRPPQIGAKPRSLGLLRSAVLSLDSRRLFILLPFAIIAGLIVSLMGTSSPDPLALLGVGAALLLVLAFSLRTSVQLYVISIAIALWCGFCLLTAHGVLSGTEMIGRPAYGTFEMRVDEILSEVDGGKRVIVSAITPTGETRPIPMRRARIVIGAGPDLAIGDIISAPVRFYSVPGPVVPGGFDSQFHGYFDGVGAYGNTTGAVEVVAHGDLSAPERIIDMVRRGISQRVDAALDQPAAGIARAIINGDQSAVTNEAREVMATAGLAHVLSISGLHLTLVAGGVFIALRMGLSLSDGIARRVSVKRLAAFGGIAAALLYFSISGGNVAALRSTIMIVLVFGAVIFGRRALTMRNVAIAALIVILSDPASVFRPSFQLSFAAVIALVGAWEAARHEEKGDRTLARQVLRYFWGLAATSLVAGAATLLFSAYHFQQTSPLGVFGNLISLPLVGFIMMPSALFAVLAMPFGFEGPFLAVMGWSINRMLELAAMVASWSGGIDASPLLTPLALVIGFLALAWFAFLNNRWRWLGPAIAIPAVFLFALDRPPDVLIADTTQAVAIRTTDGLRLVDGKPGSFAVDVWQETYGGDIGAADETITRCDSIGCIATSPQGFDLAIIKDSAGFAEDCFIADLVITRRIAPGLCARQTTVIDAQALRFGGVHWLRWDAAAEAFEIRPAMTDLNRPWRVSPL